MEVLQILFIIYSPFMMCDKEHRIKSSTSHVHNFKDWCTFQTTLSLQILISIFPSWVPIFSMLFSWTRLEKVFTTYLNLLLWTDMDTQTFRPQETIQTKLGMWQTWQPPIHSGSFLEQLWEIRGYCRKGFWYSFLYLDSHIATLLTLWPHSGTLKFMHTIYATCEYFMRDIGIKLFVLDGLKEH